MKVLAIISILSISCSSDFMGSGGSGKQRFTGDQPKSGEATPTSTSTDSGIDTGDGTQDGGGITTDGGGVDTRQYLDATIRVLRRDCSTGNSQSDCDGGSDDQSVVTVHYKVIGARSTESGQLPSGAVKLPSSIQIPRACPPNGGKVKAELYFVDNGSRIKPNKNASVGGPIGFRRADGTLWIGYERDEVGGKPAYHNNDDMVFAINCPEGTNGQQTIIEVPQLCIDTRIPEGKGKMNGIDYSGPGSDLVTDANTMSDSFGRQCNGT